MKKFNLSAVVTISIYTEVEAETLEEAIKIAEKRNIEAAHNHYIEEQMQEVWVSDEFDGMPCKIKETEV